MCIGIISNFYSQHPFSYFSYFSLPFFKYLLLSFFLLSFLEQLHDFLITFFKMVLWLTFSLLVVITNLLYFSFLWEFSLGFSCIVFNTIFYSFPNDNLYHSTLFLVVMINHFQTIFPDGNIFFCPFSLLILHTFISNFSSEGHSNDYDSSDNHFYILFFPYSMIMIFIFC